MCTESMHGEAIHAVACLLGDSGMGNGMALTHGEALHGEVTRTEILYGGAGAAGRTVDDRDRRGTVYA
ncbi:MAG: hypothetical protein ACYDGY_04995 [Acidimicrobiales bacterium]